MSNWISKYFELFNNILFFLIIIFCGISGVMLSDAVGIIWGVILGALLGLFPAIMTCGFIATLISIKNSLQSLSES